MKASVFIKVALMDQMRQIADLGLWFHVYHLLGKGVKTLGDVAVLRDPDKAEYIRSVLLDGKYAWLPSAESGSFVSGPTPQVWLYSEPEDAEKNATFDEQGIYGIHVPTLFSDFLFAAQKVLDMIESGEITDIDALPPKEKVHEANEQERRSGNSFGPPKPNACFVCGKRAVVKHQNSMIGGLVFGLCEEHKNSNIEMQAQW